MAMMVGSAGLGGAMQRFVAKANVDHYIGLLNRIVLTSDI
jgi:hypothetical protein